MGESLETLKKATRRFVPRFLLEPIWILYRLITYRDDTRAVFNFLFTALPKVSFWQRWMLARNLYKISFNVECPHTEKEVLNFIKAILTYKQSDNACFVEAGAYKGGSTAKFSLAAKIAGRRLVVFDSFEGIPPNNEIKQDNVNLFNNKPAVFREGDWKGTLEEVRANVERYGDLSVCEFVQGWFDDTMPQFKQPVAGAYVDVDLAASVRTCLVYLYPLLIPGSYIYSQDGHIAYVVNLLQDASFWQNTFGITPPYIHGLGKQKLVAIHKGS